MAKNRIPTGVMISILNEWLDPKRSRPLFENTPLLRPLLPKLEDVAAKLGATQTDGARTDFALTKLSATEAAVHDAFNDLVHGIFHTLTGYAFLAPTPEEAAAIRKLLADLLPRGLAHTLDSYAGQAGEGTLLVTRVTAVDKKLLHTLPLPNGRNVGDAVDELLARATELGGFETQRTALENQEAGSVHRSDSIAARNAWVRAAKAVESNADLAGLDAKEHSQLLGTLEREDDKANKRGVASPTPPPAGQPPTPPVASGT